MFKMSATGMNMLTIGQLRLTQRLLQAMPHTVGTVAARVVFTSHGR